MKKLAILMIMMLVFSMVCFAQGAQEAAKADPNAPKKLTMMFSSGGAGKALTAAAEKFGKERGVEMEVLTFPVGEVYEKQILALSSKQGTPDVISVDDTWMPVLHPFLEPMKNVDPTVAAELVPAYKEAFALKGNQYALPVRLGGQAIFYRKDILEKAGIDPSTLTTWEAILDAVRKVNDPANKVYGWVGGYSEDSYFNTNWLTILSGYGLDIMNEDMTKFNFLDPKAIKATEMFVELTKCASPSILSYGYNEQIAAFQDGSAVMGIVWTPRFQAINKAGLPHSGQFDVLPFNPIGEGTDPAKAATRVNGWGLGVNKYTPNKALAEEFINYVASFDTQLYLAIENSNSPVVSKIFENADFLKTVPVAEKMNTAIAKGITRPMHVRWAEMESIIKTNLQRVLIGEVSVEDGLKACQTGCEKLLKD